MNILFSTYSYYPYNYGGTEVYISGLASFLQIQGHQVTIIAGIPSKAFEDHAVFYEDNEIKTICYLQDGIKIIGVILKDQTITEIYSKYRIDWVTSWVSALGKLSKNNFDLLHLHGLTSPIGRVLIEAVKLHSKNVKIAASYHVPVTCVKGSLLFTNKKIACNVPAEAFICTACSITDKSNLPLSVTKVVTKLLPQQLGESFPTTLRIKYLVNEFVKSFHLLNKQIDSWFVFSDQIKNNLLLNKVNNDKINLIRHGVNSVFAASNKIEIQERKIKKPIVYLYAGRFDKLKGFYTLLKAWTSLKEDSNRVLKIIGENQSVDVEHNKRQNQINERSDIEWVGLQKPDALAVIMRESHCVIIPSETIEIGPLLFHEAIASGCDVIAANLGGCAELSDYYKEKTNLFESGNASALASTIQNFSFSGLSLPVNLQENNYDEVLKCYMDLSVNQRDIYHDHKL